MKIIRRTKKSKLILAMYLSSITLCIGTFSMSVAWYTSSTRLQISTVEITLDCDRQLAISTQKDRGFTTELDSDDLKNPGLFTPVTSAHQSTWFDDKKDMPIFYDDTLYSENEFISTTTVAGGGYFSQKLYLKSDNKVWVSIDPEKTYIRPHAEANAAYAQKLYETYQSGDNEEYKALTLEQVEERLNSLVKAMRFSILVNDENYYDYQIIDPNKEEVTKYGGLLDNNVDQYYDYYIDSQEDVYYERLYGEINDTSLIQYDEPTNIDSDFAYEGSPSAFNAKHKGTIKRINFEKSKGLIIKEEESYSTEDFKVKDKPFMFPVYWDHPQEIVLSVYIEGWDLDSINYTMGATFDANLVFTIEGDLHI